MTNTLEIKNLEIDYGIVKAVKGINMTVPKGSIIALLGANGAGKHRSFDRFLESRKSNPVRFYIKGNPFIT